MGYKMNHIVHNNKQRQLEEKIEKRQASMDKFGERKMLEAFFAFESAGKRSGWDCRSVSSGEKILRSRNFLADVQLRLGGLSHPLAHTNGILSAQRTHHTHQRARRRIRWR